MHDDEVEVSDPLVARLVAGQFPGWAGLPLRRVASSGTDNALYRLGDELAMRLPRRPAASAQVMREHHWLPRLAPFLPLPVPEPLEMGEPGEGYPWAWSVYRWLPGENAALDRLDDAHAAAADLAGFVRALQAVDPADAPSAGAESWLRGMPLAACDQLARTWIERLSGEADTAAVTAAWEAALRAPPWDGPPVWFHGDLQASNLLADSGRLYAVIDFGCMGVGDPACDAMPAWLYFSRQTRRTYREALGADDATWARGRGWALYVGMAAVPYYKDSNPVFAAVGRRAIEEVLDDTEADDG